MVFSSLTFICVFFPVTFILHFIANNIKVKNTILIIASLIFYAYGEPVYIFLMLGSTVLNYFFGLGCSNPNKTKKSLFLVAAIIVNISILVIFKYTDFMLASLTYWKIFYIELPGITLPLGISFYTFQSLSYVIDVYREDVKAQKNFFNLVLYISFFPQLVAGPIVKYHDIEYEILNRKPNLDDITAGVSRFCFGLAKKVLIANTMANVVDNIYSSSCFEINIFVGWIAALCYLMQIYFDFSGYSDMAIGMARMFGFHYKENFNFPYTSKTVKEFWKKWHISLSTWFKDYLYIPLGGNKKGKLRTSINKVIVFLTCGLWHGANWTFVIWGLGHGLFLLMEDYFPIQKLPKFISWLYTFIVVTVLFVIFRSDSLEQASFILSQMFFGFHFEDRCVQLILQLLSPINITTFVVAIFSAFNLKKFILRRNNLLRNNCLVVIKYIFCIILLILCVFTLAGGGYNPFIYFRF